jgi:alkylhydroperoxidase/carboxymuconolactone decarboxylase family protein YurZ
MMMPSNERNGERHVTVTTGRTDDHAEVKATVKARFEARRGFWDPLWDPVLDNDPHLLDAYIDLSGVPWRDGTLHPRIRELIYVAMNASTTHLYHVGVRVHLRNAIAHGATIEEAGAVLALVSELGSHTLVSTLAVLAEELTARGVAVPDADDSLREDYAIARGAWDPEFEPVAQLAPAYLEAFNCYAEVTRRRGVLDESTMHLVAIAYSASATHLHMPAVRMHLRRALDAGVPWEQILEVLEVVGMVGVHTITDCMVIVAEEFADAAKAGTDA